MTDTTKPAERPVPVHPQFGPQHPGRSHPQPHRPRPLQGLFGWQQPARKPATQPAGAAGAAESAGISTEGLHSKNWDEFGTVLDAPHMDLVITVCDNAAGEVCPYWPGQPATAHWGYPDPSAGEGTEAEKLEAFRQTLYALKRRLELLVSLPTEKLEKTMLQGTARDLATR
jgi:protein-tyrosine-phosphatase